MLSFVFEMCDEENSDEFNELSLADNEYKRLNEKVEKDGLRDGMYEGSEQALQKGFNDGYNGSFKCYHSVYFLRGILSAIESRKKDCATDADVISLRAQFDAIERLIDDNLDGNTGNEEISEKFNRIKCEIIELCAKNNLKSLKDCINDCEI